MLRLYLLWIWELREAPLHTMGPRGALPTDLSVCNYINILMAGLAFPTNKHVVVLMGQWSGDGIKGALLQCRSGTLCTPHSKPWAPWLQTRRQSICFLQRGLSYCKSPTSFCNFWEENPRLVVLWDSASVSSLWWWAALAQTLVHRSHGVAASPLAHGNHPVARAWASASMLIACTQPNGPVPIFCPVAQGRACPSRESLHSLDTPGRWETSFAIRWG